MLIDNTTWRDLDQVLFKLKGTEAVFQNNGLFSDISNPVLQFCLTRQMATMDYRFKRFQEVSGFKSKEQKKPSKHTGILHG